MKAPLCDALIAYREEAPLRLHVPGHKGVCPYGMELLGEDIFSIDSTEVPGLDDLHHPRGPILQAQRLLARAYGADESFFLVNGTTGGIHAALLAILSRGDKVLIPRNAHKSVIGGVILCGAIPIYLKPTYVKSLGHASHISIEEVKGALKAHPDAKCLVVTNPDYWGLAGDIVGMVNLAHGAGIPLVIDEAHGPHFSFHPELPPSGLEAGADVVVQSPHKLLGSLTQTSFLHWKGSRVSVERLRLSLRLIGTSSPSYPLMASLDAVRRLMELQGRELLDAALLMADKMRATINKIDGFKCFTQGNLEGVAMDPTKLIITGRELGLTGYDLGALLRKEHGIQVEFADLNNVLVIVTIGDKGYVGERLIGALGEMADKMRGQRPLIFQGSMEQIPMPEQDLTPQEAFFASYEWVELRDAVGRTSQAVVAPYPPGIPLLCPGERIEKEVIEVLEKLKYAGAMIHGLEEDSLVAVVK
jgi:arginine decarboxylase